MRVEPGPASTARRRGTDSAAEALAPAAARRVAERRELDRTAGAPVRPFAGRPERHERCRPVGASQSLVGRGRRRAARARSAAACRRRPCRRRPPSPSRRGEDAAAQREALLVARSPSATPAVTNVVAGEVAHRDAGCSCVHARGSASSRELALRRPRASALVLRASTRPSKHVEVARLPVGRARAPHAQQLAAVARPVERAVVVVPVEGRRTSPRRRRAPSSRSPTTGCRPSSAGAAISAQRRGHAGGDRAGGARVAQAQLLEPQEGEHEQRQQRAAQELVVEVERRRRASRRAHEQRSARRAGSPMRPRGAARTRAAPRRATSTRAAERDHGPRPRRRPRGRARARPGSASMPRLMPDDQLAPAVGAQQLVGRRRRRAARARAPRRATRGRGDRRGAAPAAAPRPSRPSDRERATPSAYRARSGAAGSSSTIQCRRRTRRARQNASRARSGSGSSVGSLGGRARARGGGAARRACVTRRPPPRPSPRRCRCGRRGSPGSRRPRGRRGGSRARPGTTSRQPPGVRPSPRGGRSTTRAATRTTSPRRFCAATSAGPVVSSSSASRTCAAGQASRSGLDDRARAGRRAAAAPQPVRRAKCTVSEAAARTAASSASCDGRRARVEHDERPRVGLGDQLALHQPGAAREGRPVDARGGRALAVLAQAVELGLGRGDQRRAGVRGDRRRRRPRSRAPGGSAAARAPRRRSRR